MTRKRGRIGSSFDSFLKEDDIRDEVTAGAIKRVLARQLVDAMQAANLSKSEMARRMNTSRSHLDRFLDPNNSRIQLDTLFRAAEIVGRQVKLELI